MHFRKGLLEEDYRQTICGKINYTVIFLTMTVRLWSKQRTWKNFDSNYCTPFIFGKETRQCRRIRSFETSILSLCGFRNARPNFVGTPKSNSRCSGWFNLPILWLFEIPQDATVKVQQKAPHLLLRNPQNYTKSTCTILELGCFMILMRSQSQR